MAGLAPTPAATWRGVRLRQSQHRGESGVNLTMRAIISRGGS